MKHVAIDKKLGAEVALDSGAFTAYMGGDPIQLVNPKDPKKGYIRFLEENAKEFSWYANLDAMPPKKMKTEAEYTAARVRTAEETWQNQLKMEAAGLSPVPVFHHREDIKYLKRYLNRNHFIALGGITGRPRKENQNWLDMIFGRYLCDEKRMPRARYHSFGLTASWCMERYPWWSSDSSSWVIPTGLGCIFVPKGKKKAGKWHWDYSRPYRTIEVCKPANNPRENVWHMFPEGRKAVAKYIESEGMSLGESEIDWWPRGKPLPPNFRTVNENRAFYSEPSKDWIGWGEKEKQKTHQRVEVIIEDGVCNNLAMRRQLAANYFMKLGDHYEWPPIVPAGREFLDRSL